MIQAIVSKIEEMIEIHSKLNQLALDKTQAIINGDMKTLDSIVNQEEAITAHLSQLENERIKLVQAYTEENGGETTFAALIERAPEEVKDRLSDLHGQLAEQVFNLKNQNDLNHDLIKQSLEWVHVNLKLLNPQPAIGNYSNPKTGQKKAAQGFSRFDSRA